MTALYADTANVPYRAASAAVRTRDREVRFAIVEYTFTGDEEANDVIHFKLELEKGSEVLTQLGRVVNLVTAATALTIDIGDDDGAGDPDRYGTALDVATAGDDVVFDAHPYYTLTGQAEISALIKTIDTPVAGGKLRFYVPYLCQ